MEQVKPVHKRKWFIGCGVLVTLVLIAAIVVFWFIFRKAKTLMSGFQNAPSAYTELLKKDRFVPPRDKIISEQDLKNYLAITAEIREKIDQWYQQEKGQKINWEQDNIGSQLLGSLFKIRQIQAEVLKEHNFSLKKYKWITRELITVFGGIRLKQYNLLVKATQSGLEEVDAIEELKHMPQENLSLFERYEGEIKEALKLWILGI